MANPLRNFLLNTILKIPPEPEVPFGEPGSVQVFNAHPNFYYYQLVKWFIGTLSTALGLLFGLLFLGAVPEFKYDFLITVAELLGIAAFLVHVVFSFMMVRINYELRWYIITDRSLRIREGVLQVQERTMSFANIQNLSIEQGPIQRLFKIMDLKVRSAGGGGAMQEGNNTLGEDMHVGYFRGVGNAAEIRDTIRKRLEKLKDSGLGDPDDYSDHADQPKHRPSSGTDDATTLAAARDVLQEVRQLRQVAGDWTKTAQ